VTGARSPGRARVDLVSSDLAELVAFVAAYLAAFGHTLDRGDLVLSGSYTPKAVAPAPGEGASAEFGPLGTVSVRLSA
jgi:2-keto-4-pentenoate hydratase